ncbi:putative calcium ion binding protein [Corchorus olitorius]|uniref:Calcium ion binding protein n=1 Tax=Corchorus olitorius TaxID=93759 RepID=A0A1R3K485_9ROSI|nr:putative calcium ion binding protein [Corchorus olitorius]
MGNSMGGFMGKGLPSTQMLGYVFKSLHEQFTDSEIKDFDDFHAAILDILSVINSALPGKHYDAPSRDEVENCFQEWKGEEDPVKKKEIFIQFITKIKLSKLDNNTIMTGILTPPAAMAAKRAGEFLPHLSMIKAIPDVVFVPSVTVAALVISKLSRRLYHRSAKSQPLRSKSISEDRPEEEDPVPEETSPPCPPDSNQ